MKLWIVLIAFSFSPWHFHSAWISVLIVLWIVIFCIRDHFSKLIWIICKNECLSRASFGPEQTKHIQHILTFGHATDVDNHLRITYNNEIFLAPFLFSGTRTRTEGEVKRNIHNHKICDFLPLYCVLWNHFMYLNYVLSRLAGLMVSRPAATSTRHPIHIHKTSGDVMCLCLHSYRRVCSAGLGGLMCQSQSQCHKSRAHNPFSF